VGVCHRLPEGLAGSTKAGCIAMGWGSHGESVACAAASRLHKLPVRAVLLPRTCFDTSVHGVRMNSFLGEAHDLPPPPMLPRIFTPLKAQPAASDEPLRFVAAWPRTNAPTEQLPKSDRLPRSVLPRPSVPAYITFVSTAAQIPTSSTAQSPSPSMPPQLPRIVSKKNRCSQCWAARVGGGYILIGWANLRGQCKGCRKTLDYACIEHLHGIVRCTLSQHLLFCGSAAGCRRFCTCTR
jgi:hypothetical protein